MSTYTAQRYDIKFSQVYRILINNHDQIHEVCWGTLKNLAMIY